MFVVKHNAIKIDELSYACWWMPQGVHGVNWFGETILGLFVF